MSSVPRLPAPERRRLTGNRFVDALPRDAAEQIGRLANLRVYSEGTVLSLAGAPITDVCFPIAGTISHLEDMSDGESLEVVSVGCDGVSQFEVVLGEPTAQYRRVAPVPVSAFVLSAHAMLDLAARWPEVRALAARYAVAVMRAAGLSGACARHDRIEPRLAAWLLGVFDYAQTPTLSITHDRIAALLGVRRAGITDAFAALTRAGAVRVARHHITIADVATLETLACGCRSEARAALEAVYDATGRTRSERARHA